MVATIVPGKGGIDRHGWMGFEGLAGALVKREKSISYMVLLSTGDRTRASLTEEIFFDGHLDWRVTCHRSVGSALAPDELPPHPVGKEEPTTA